MCQLCILKEKRELKVQMMRWCMTTYRCRQSRCAAFGVSPKRGKWTIIVRALLCPETWQNKQSWCSEELTAVQSCSPSQAPQQTHQSNLLQSVSPLLAIRNPASSVSQRLTGGNPCWYQILDLEKVAWIQRGLERHLEDGFVWPWSMLDSSPLGGGGGAVPQVYHWLPFKLHCGLIWLWGELVGGKKKKKAHIWFFLQSLILMMSLKGAAVVESPMIQMSPMTVGFKLIIYIWYHVWRYNSAHFTGTKD